MAICVGGPAYSWTVSEGRDGGDSARTAASWELGCRPVVAMRMGESERRLGRKQRSEGEAVNPATMIARRRRRAHEMALRAAHRVLPRLPITSSPHVIPARFLGPPTRLVTRVTRVQGRPRPQPRLGISWLPSTLPSTQNWLCILDPPSQPSRLPVTSTQKGACHSVGLRATCSQYLPNLRSSNGALVLESDFPTCLLDLGASLGCHPRPRYSL